MFLFAVIWCYFVTATTEIDEELESKGVKFIKILRAHFLYKSALCSFCLVHFGFVILGVTISANKSAHKMLMKLTTYLSDI